MLHADKTGIQFNNQITEKIGFSVLNYEYIYNGGGVGIGDFNNDGLPDIYFTGNMVSNKLYLNKGNMRFEDITSAAGISGDDKWCKGVSVVDVNNDGLMDIYVCAAVLSNKKNILYVNKGIDKKTNLPYFNDEATEYGLADSSNSQMAAFFDYDNDGDLDVYLLVNDLIHGAYPNEFRPINKTGNSPNADKLFDNSWSKILKHPVFTNVSKQAGISIEGYGLGINIVDINNDGWKDIYVSNDYLSNNILYVNNHDGTFTDKCAAYFKHTSKNAMGNDIADINNDGLPDVVELDMAPAENYRLKMMFNDLKYETQQDYARYGYMQQYPRNSLQLNLGNRVLDNDSIGNPTFSDVAYYAGIAHTDWSWAPLAVDIDNDGYRDLMITNGLPHDMSDLDFMAYRNYLGFRASTDELINKIPPVKTSNYIFHNNGDITFTDKTKAWGWDFPTISSGMAYADLDGDGDEDVVINNTNMPATVLQNLVCDNKKGQNNFLSVRLKGSAQNRNSIGAVIHIYYQGKQQVYECTPYRGYMSSVENTAHFGVGNLTNIDSVVIIFNDTKKLVMQNVATNQKIIADIAKADDYKNYTTEPIDTIGLFTDITKRTGINFLYSEEDFIDFYIQHLLPHKLTQYGPSLASADLNGDGLDDVVVGGGSPHCAALFFQKKDGSFQQKQLYDLKSFKYQDDAGICLFDADSDGDADMYIASGGAENGPGYSAYADNFYVNDGKGNFKKDSIALRGIYTAKSCVKAADYDNDGDLDLFIGGRVLPGSYPLAVSSIILRNDTQNGKIKFTNVTSSVAPALQNIGMVCDAVWSDADNDDDIDLIIAGEWMPVTVFKNESSRFTPVKTNLSDERGWWNSITGADIDNDGDIDYIVGNCGLNGFLHPSEKQPVKAYGKDFDNNGTFDAVISMYYRSSLSDTSIKEFPVAGRDDFIKEMSIMKGNFPNYASYATSTIQNIFSQEQLKGAVQVSANNFNTCWIENKGNMQFVLHALPAQAQWAPVYAITTADFNGDGNIDIALNGNEFSMTPQLGRYDAMNGLVMQGDGKGNFTPLSIMQSGLYIPGNGKTFTYFNMNDTPVLIAGENAGMLKLFKLKNAQFKSVALKQGDMYAIIKLKNGKKRKEEFYYGSSFLSQSARNIFLNPSIQSVEIFNNKKQKKVIGN